MLVNCGFFFSLDTLRIYVLGFWIPISSNIFNTKSTSLILSSSFSTCNGTPLITMLFSFSKQHHLFLATIHFVSLFKKIISSHSRLFRTRVRSTFKLLFKVFVLFFQFNIFILQIFYFISQAFQNRLNRFYILRYFLMNIAMLALTKTSPRRQSDRLDDTLHFQQLEEC